MGARALRFTPPFAKISSYRMKTHGKYKGGGPAGLVVHFTAGEDGAENVIRMGVKNGYAYWDIQRDGQLYCAHSGDEYGWHAGESRWKLSGVLTKSVSKNFIGIEMNSAGGVKPDKKTGDYKTYWGKYLKPEMVRYVRAEDNRAEGYYHVYTWEQEVTLVNTILWCAREFPKTFKFENVVGHDEISGKKMLGYFRKTDPGGSLSVTMTRLRTITKHLHERGIKSVDKDFRLREYRAV